jgi:hypothetical protein
MDKEISMMIVWQNFLQVKIHKDKSESLNLLVIQL